MLKSFAQVLLPLALDETFSYKAEGEVKRGDVVSVEFGRKKIWGVVFDVENEAPKSIAAEKIKPILEINSCLKLSENNLKFIATIASYNLCSRGLVLRAFMGILNSDKIKKLPKALEQKILTEKFNLKKLLPKQQEVLQKINDEKPFVTLLDGVTGSGKTEIYFALIAEILAKNSQAQILILLPEIALTSQLLMRFEQQFAFTPALWHSKISKKNKREIFYGVASGGVRVLIGARSSLLLPFKNLQLIVVDEEHDSSLKQEDVFNFHARDMAIARAKIDNFQVVLSSATPSVETYANAVSGKYLHLILEQRFGQKNDIELVDLRQEKLQSGEFLSQKLRREIAINLAKNKQSLLFLNRRGYAPVTLCKSCGKKYQCADCDFHLVLHKSKQQLTCHHCGHFEKLISQCKFCGEENAIISIGAGVEKIAEEVQRTFPQSRIVLATSDNITSFADVDELVSKILNKEADIIIGTQMIAKGHDFPDLNLVGIIDADAMLYSSELRALEKTYQTLTQVTGRAGRHLEKGKVIIQTYNPQNFIFENITKGEKKDFYDFEIKNREALALPPFARMAKFEVSSFTESEAKNFAKKLISHFPFDEKIEIFGPAPAPLQRLKNRHHFLVNLKVEKKVNLQKLILDVMSTLQIPKAIRVRIDVDPI